MANALAIWGAVTGTIGTLTGVGALARGIWREHRDSKLKLEVTHGWQFSFKEDRSIRDVWVCVTLYNRGRRPVHVQYVGFEAPVVGDRSMAEERGLELGDGRRVWTNLRLEIALGDEAVEVAPDGPRVRIWTRLAPICRYGIDPTMTDFAAFAVTYHEIYWWERPLPLLPEPVQPYRTVEEMGEAVAHFFLEDLGDEEMAPAPRRAGSVVGLQRIIVDGDAFHVRASDLFRVERDDADEADE
jgi:hypothetical protein